MATNRIRFSYLIERARSLRPGNLLAVARQSRRVTRKPVVWLIVDMLWCSVRYELGFKDYALWEFSTLTRAERKTWMTHPKSHRLNIAVNSQREAQWYSDKVRFYSRFADVIGREWLDLRECDTADFESFVARHPRIIVKPAAGVGGRGVELIEPDASADLTSLRRKLISSGQVLIEAVIEQHSALSQLYPGAVNTVRMITFLSPQGTLQLLAAVLRIGNGSAVDNFASGGMYSLLDADGRVPFPAVDRSGTAYEVHPSTGTPIRGFVVPEFDRVWRFLEEVARRVPDVPYVGWDVAITPDGPVLIEANHNSTVFQTPPSVSSVRTGLLSVYSKAAGMSL